MPDPTPGPAPRPAIRRRFTLLDGIVLVAAFAGGLKGHQVVQAVLARSRMSQGAVGAGEVIRDIRARGFLKVPLHVTYWAESAMPWLMTAAFVLLALRLIPPRPARARLVGRHGSLAIRATVGTIAATWLSYALALLPLERAGLISADMPSWAHKPVFHLVSLSAMAAAGAAVAASWLTASCRRSRGRADWIDRTGVALGVVMIAATPFYLWISLLYRH